MTRRIDLGLAPGETPGYYAFTDDMDEISGFGGGYEATCREMVVQGLKWFDAHSEAVPQFHGYTGIFGVLSEDNADAKALSAAMMDGPLAHDLGVTGAMHQACVSHVLWIRKYGWARYVAESRARKTKETKG